MMINVVTISGASLSDTCFTIYLPSQNGEVTWNVTKILRAIEADMFGEPREIDGSGFPPNYETGFLDLDKIAKFKTMPEILAIPAIGIGADHKNECHLLCFADGQHRLAARYELGMSYLFYLVPALVERQFRIHGLPSMEILK